MDRDNNEYLIETCEAFNKFKRDKNLENLHRFSTLIENGIKSNSLDIADLMLIFHNMNNDYIDSIRKLKKGIYV